MSALSSAGYFADLIAHRPDLVGLYLRNRVREGTLRLDHRRADGASRWPRNVTFKLTLSCNLRCRMCAYSRSGQVTAPIADSMPPDRWMAVIDDVARFRPYISLTGGEPLLYPHLGELLHHIKRRGLMCTLTTNGTLLSKLAEPLMEHPPDMLMVSIDGPADVHDDIRGMAGTFDRAVEGLRAVHEIRDRKRNRRPWTVVTCAVTPDSYRSVEEMPVIARLLRADVLNFQHEWLLTREMVVAHNRRYGPVHAMDYEEMGGMEMPTVDAEEVGRAMDRIGELGRVSGGVYISQYPQLDSREVRRWYENPHHWIRRRVPACAWDGVNILPNGDVEACAGMITGNVTGEPLTRIWNNEAFRAHRRRLIESRGFPICLRCCRYFRVD